MNMKVLETLRTSGTAQLLLRFTWYLFLLFLIFLFYSAPQRSFRYFGL